MNIFNRITLLAVFSLVITHNSWAISIGDNSPKIFGRDISGDIFALSRLENKPKVINFFWIECKPCQKELPLLAKKEMQYPGVIFAAIHAERNQATDSNYSIEDIQAFAKTLKAHPKLLVLGSDRLKTQFGIKGFPATVLLGPDNKVEKIIYGFNDNTIKQLSDWLKKQS